MSDTELLALREALEKLDRTGAVIGLGTGNKARAFMAAWSDALSVLHDTAPAAAAIEKRIREDERTRFARAVAESMAVNARFPHDIAETLITEIDQTRALLRGEPYAQD